jgi:hypothetical protein
MKTTREYVYGASDLRFDSEDASTLRDGMSRGVPVLLK